MKVKNFFGLIFLMILTTLFVASCTSVPVKDTFEIPEEAIQKVPDGATWRQEKVFRDFAPEHYMAFDPHIVGWAQVATVHSDSARKPSKVVVKDFKVTAVLPDGSERDLDVRIYDKPTSSYDSGLFIRKNRWFPTNENTPIKHFWVDQKKKVLIIDAEQTPNKVIHWWTWRAPVVQGARYVVKMKALIMGDARLQLGSDFWIDGNSDWNGWHRKCVGTNNCEAMVSDWYGDTKGSFKSFVAPSRTVNTAQKQ